MLPVLKPKGIYTNQHRPQFSKYDPTNGSHVDQLATDDMPVSNLASTLISPSFY